MNVHDTLTRHALQDLRSPNIIDGIRTTSASPHELWPLGSSGTSIAFTADVEPTQFFRVCSADRNSIRIELDCPEPFPIRYSPGVQSWFDSVEVLTAMRFASDSMIKSSFFASA